VFYVLHELAADLDCGRCNARFSIHYPDISTQDGFEDWKPNFKHEFLRARTRDWNEDFTVV
jgi:hypothetical protein